MQIDFEPMKNFLFLKMTSCLFVAPYGSLIEVRTSHLLSNFKSVYTIRNIIENGELSNCLRFVQLNTKLIRCKNKNCLNG